MYPNESRPAISMTPWVRRLIIANAVVYLLTLTVLTGPWFQALVAFSPSAGLQRPWTAVTYMFVHAEFLHIAFNMLMLFFFGSAVEQHMGGRGFVRYYFFCGFGGAALSFAIALVLPVAPFVGASAAVFGVSLAFAMYWPDTPIFIFPIPFPIKAKWLVIGMATIDLAATLFQTNNGVANLAHLGGFLFGLIYLKGLPMLQERRAATIEVERGDPESHVLVHPIARQAEADAEENAGSRPHPQQSSRRDEVDRVLDKISETGLSSLTPAERRVLDEMSEYLRDH